MSAAQTASDAELLAHFEELLDLGKQARAERLEVLAAEDSRLHSRLLRMLAAATNGTRVLSDPIVDALRVIENSAALIPEPGHAVNGYRLLRELGRGGMASVWLAERSDGIVKRNVALKLPLFALRSPLQIARFEQEREVLAGLAHPHIARLYDAGVTPGGQPFIVLEYIDGVPITDYCDTHQLSIRERLQLFMQVLAAVNHAHKHLTVHRDLKPSNILVDTEGQVKLLDFGIAKLLAEPAAGAALPKTQFGSAALTLLYSAPEQITQLPISTLTDVYVLGLVLYELLSGALPYTTTSGATASLEQILDMQLHGTHHSLRKAVLTDTVAQARALPDALRLRRSLQGDLDTIVQKALRHAAEQRYSSVEHFADDLRRFLQQRPIAAHPAGFGYAAGLFLRRHRKASWAIAAGALITLAASTSAWQKHVESRASAARSIAVRDFMFELVNDAEPNELQPEAAVTGKQMVDGAVRRARRTFGAQPQLQGELLGELGRMYFRLDEPASGTQILEEAVTLLEAHAPPSDAALNKARSHLAHAILTRHPEERARANALALAARSQCTQDSTDCAKARSYAGLVISMIHRAEGQLEEGLDAMRASVQEGIRAFGANQPDTAMAWINLAITARRAGHLKEAEAAAQQAAAIASSLTLPAADRLLLQWTGAMLDIDLGRYEKARRNLEELVRNTTSAKERGRQLSLLANVLFEQGEPAAAAAAAQASLALLGPAASSPSGILAGQLLARSQALLGQTEQALQTITQVNQTLHDKSVADDAPEAVRTRRIRGEILLRAGRFSESFAAVEPLARRVGPSLAHEFEAALSLEVLGCILRELHRVQEAAAAHTQARAYLQKHLPAGHPFLARNTLYEIAATKDSNSIGQQVTAFEQQLPSTSIWRRLLAVRADGSSAACANAGLKSCVLVF